MQIVIFSYNRAIQLDTLITSLKKHWQSPEYHIDVLYNTSNDLYHQGYSLLMDKFKSENISFCKEQSPKGHGYPLSLLADFVNLKALYRHKYLRKAKTNFRALLLDLIANDSSKEIMFMTDDSQFIRDVTITDDVLSCLHAAPADRQISLRLGRGINGEERLHIGEENGWLTWNMSKLPPSKNWTYCFSVDAHIYDKSVLLPMLRKTVFSNPSSLEELVHERVQRSRRFQEAKAPLQTALLSFPINMVQTVADNETLGVSTEMLNDYYLRGYRLEYPIPEHYDAFQIYPDHLTFIKGKERKDVLTRKTDL